MSCTNMFRVKKIMTSCTNRSCAKKYYDFVADFELNDLAENGIDGVKVKVFSTSMDTKGREELMGMQACSSYQGCPVCTLKFTAGRCVGKKRNCV